MKCKDIALLPYRSVLRWVKEQNPTQDKPIDIPKYGGRSRVPFRVWPFAGCLLLMSGEKANHEAQYILTPEKWRSFVDFVKKNPEMGPAELARHFKDYGCTNKLFWPSIISNLSLGIPIGQPLIVGVMHMANRGECPLSMS